jgi:hypothetical protein
MKQTIVFSLIMLAMVLCAKPVLAQDGDAFFNALQYNLSGQAAGNRYEGRPSSEIMADRDPALGESVRLDELAADSEVLTGSGTYNAGRDDLTGRLAGGALLLATLVIVLILAIITSPPYSEKRRG